jgi:hypothetical protein
MARLAGRIWISGEFLDTVLARLNARMDEKLDQYAAGAAQANADIVAGNPQYFAGARGSWAHDMEVTLKQDFGVALVVTSCIAWDDLLQFRRGYNEVIETHVDSRHGPAAFQKALDGVQERRKAAYDKWLVDHSPNH